MKAVSHPSSKSSPPGHSGREPILPYDVRPSIRSLFPALVAIGALWVLAWWVTEQIDGSATIVVPLVPLVTAILFVRPFLHLFDSRLTISEHHLRLVTGICSFRRKQVDLPYEDVLGVEVWQTLLERILRIGTLSIGDAVPTREQIVLHHVGSPGRAAEMINERIDSARIRHRRRTGDRAEEENV